jgi:E3 ubiquitin-protein ligase DOA10
MISICKCKGSMNLIHLKCLKSWIGHKLTVKEITKKMGISYIVKSYNCEICKEPYPSIILVLFSPNQAWKYSLQFTNIFYT